MGIHGKQDRTSRRSRRSAVRRICGLRSHGRSCLIACILIGASIAHAEDQAGGQVAPLRIVGDGIPQPLTSVPGRAERGRALVVERGAANCLLCHAVPGSTVSGDVGPSLAGVGRRLSEAQIRLRIVDIQRVKPDAVMPSYYRVAGLNRVASEYHAKPVLDAQQVEDVVAYLETLK